ncbi:RNA polymerase factor sigma-54 [Ferrovibrio sp.]|uniref:RNA polymerase factor sigma-54 n=1 Tax=Ferrovibrio sp. TaxID=1917215 RepID=UPI00260326A7|nr:RNA polymerase factor sigma-54 [Ferrovibrio sp.]
MALGPRLELRQGQALVMTPQLQQAIKLLQLSNLELMAYVEQELERNPLLERVDGENPSGDDTKDPFEVAEANAAVERLDLASDTITEKARESLDVDSESDSTFNNDSGYDAMGPESGLGSNYISGRGGDSRFEDEGGGLENSLTETRSLREHVQDHWLLMPANAGDRLIGQALIDSLDEAGYITEPLEEIAERLGVGADDVEAVLLDLQTIEPAGLFARSLKECLALQLRERDRLDPAMQAMLDNLELLAKRDIAGLMRICGVDQEDIADMVQEIRALNPKPGLLFGGEPVQTLVPDVYVRRGNDGSWLVELNSDTLPRVLVNSRYYAKVTRGEKNANGKDKDKQTKSYMSDCLNSANWLVKSLDQRAQTILKVASEIVRQQDAFLRHGVAHLKPLNLRAVAEAIEMHESTVSRVTSNKTMATPRGIFEMKYFFTASIAATDGGEAFSAESIRHRIKSLIDGEAAEDVLSDDKIVEVLAGKGVDIARRTVAKYREAMNIPSSVERRRLKKAGLLKTG